MDEIAEFTQRVLVLRQGKLLLDTTPHDLFYQEDVEGLGLSLPHTVKIVKLLKERGIVLPEVLSQRELIDALTQYLGGSHA